MKSTRRLFAAVMILALLFTNGSVAALAKTLKLPTSVEKIEQEAFYGDKSLDKVVLGDKVENIGPRAFANSSLKEINLPKSLKAIDNTAFDGP